MFAAQRPLAVGAPHFPRADALGPSPRRHNHLSPAVKRTSFNDYEDAVVLKVGGAGPRDEIGRRISPTRPLLRVAPARNAAFDSQGLSGGTRAPVALPLAPAPRWLSPPHAWGRLSDTNPALPIMPTHRPSGA